MGFLTQEKDFLFDKSFIEILLKDEYVIDFRNRLNCNICIPGTNPDKKIIKSYDALNDFYFKSVEEDISPTNQILPNFLFSLILLLRLYKTLKASIL